MESLDNKKNSTDPQNIDVKLESAKLEFATQVPSLVNAYTQLDAMERISKISANILYNKQNINRLLDNKSDDQQDTDRRSSAISYNRHLDNITDRSSLVKEKILQTYKLTYKHNLSNVNASFIPANINADHYKNSISDDISNSKFNSSTSSSTVNMITVNADILSSALKVSVSESDETNNNSSRKAKKISEDYTSHILELNSNLTDELLKYIDNKSD